MNFWFDAFREPKEARIRFTAETPSERMAILREGILRWKERLRDVTDEKEIARLEENIEIARANLKALKSA